MLRSHRSVLVTRALLIAVLSALMLGAFAPVASAAGYVRFTAVPDRETNDTRELIQWRGTRSATSFKCRLDGESFQRCGTAKVLRGLDEGRHVFTVAAKRKGKTQRISWTWTVDLTRPDAPAVSSNRTGWSSEADTTLTASDGGDDLSGFDHYESEVSLDNGVTWAARVEGATRTISREGRTLVRFRSVDQAGNPSRYIAIASLLDRVAPSAPTVTGGNGATGWQSVAFVDFVGTSSDDTSGVVDYQAHTSTDAGTTWSSFTSAGVLGGLRVTSEATTLVEYRAIDAAGNVSDSSAAGDSAKAMIDRTAPVAPTVVLPVGPIDGVHAISGTSSDALSGMASVTVAHTGAATGTVCTDSTASAGWGCTWDVSDLTRGAYTVTATSTDAAGNTASGSANVTVADAAVVVAESGGSSAAAEGLTDTYTVRLATQPNASVTVALAANGQVDLSSATLTFTTSNWSTPQTVTVTAVDDNVDEALDMPVAITHTLTSTDAAYDALANAGVTFSVHDNDVAAITLAHTSGSTDVTEGGVTDTYTARLATQPIADVTLTLTGTQVTASAPTLTFTSANWSTPQSVTVTASDDLVDEGTTHAGSIAHAVASDDANYSGLSAAVLSVTVTDNDVAGATVTEVSGTNVTEGGATDTYTVVLNTQPTASVSIAVAGDSQVSASPTPLTFTTANWSTPQTVTVTATDDQVDEDGHTGTVTHTVTSSDTYYDGLSVASVIANVTDDDTAALTIVESTSTDVTEGGTTDTFTVRLATQPTATATVNVAVDSQVTAAPTSAVFTTANWSTPQTITVTAVNDPDVEAATHDGVVSLSVTSTDAKQAALTGSVTANVTDNDVAGFTVARSSGTNAVLEAGATSDSYTIVLNSRPSADVVVTPTADGTQVTSSPATLTFTYANWSTPQTVTVTAIDDNDDEATSHTGSVSHAADSADTNYDGLALASESVTVTDNDTSALAVVESSGTSVTEGGATDTFTVALTTKPTADVTVTLSNSAQIGATPSPLTFTSANWSTPQTVTVTATNDGTPEGTLSYDITLDPSSADTLYNALSSSTVGVTVVDNDADYLVVETDAGTAVTEASGANHTDTADVRLSTQPLSDVVVTVATDTQVSASPNTLTFTPANWATIQTVTITAVDDDVDEASTHNGVTTFTAASGDANYNNKMTTITATVTDDDTRGLVITGSPSVSEDNVTTDTYTIKLASEPTADVDITLTGTQVTATSPLTFTTVNWDTPQTVTVTPIDDFIDEASPHAGSISYTLTGGDYDAFVASNTAVSVYDNDVAGYEIQAIGGVTTDVTEGGATDTFRFRLTSEPTADVDVALDGTQVTVDASPLTFTSGNWTAWQTVTVTAIDDNIQETSPTDGNVAFDATSGDAVYQSLAVATHTVSVTDDDTAGVTITETGSTDVDEANLLTTDTYTVELNTVPTANVTVTIDAGTQVSVDDSSLVFTAGDWNVPQTVTVTAVSDDVDETDPHTGTITHTVTSTDAFYDGVSVADVDANVADDDTAALVIDEDTGVDVTEGDTVGDTYTVALATEPTSDVTVTVTDGAQATASPSTLEFTSADWDTPQVVTVVAVDDDIDEDADTQDIVNDVTAGDAEYMALADATVTADVVDNDTVGLTVVEAGGTTVAEAGTTSDTVTVQLATEPIDDVTVTPSVNGEITTPTGPLTFTAANWDTPQTVTVTAVNDSFDDDADTGELTLTPTSAGDAKYNALAADVTTVTVTDNDTAGVTVTESGGTTAVNEAGLTTDTFTVRLDSEPTADVTIVLTGTLVDVDLGSLTFTPTGGLSPWNVPQTVTVTAQADSFDNGTTFSASVAYGISGGDYNAVTHANTTVTVTDNDTAGFTVVQSGGSTLVNENGATDSYTIVLTSQPAANVMIDVTAATNQVVIAGAPLTLTFTSVNWNVPQTVSLSTPNDATPEGLQTVNVSHAISGAAQYAALTLADVSVTVMDNDHAVLVSETTASVNEEGATTDTYTLVLTTQPSANVTVTITHDGQISTAASKTFTAANWSTPQTVTITAVDDNDDELDPHTSNITHSTASADLNYNALAGIGSVLTSIADNDTSALVIAESATTTDVTEGGATDTYTVRLATKPTGNVDVNVAGGAQASALPAQLNFTTLNWSTPQTVTVTATDDDIDDDASATQTISNTVDAGSADALYVALSAVNVTANVTDNDTRGVTLTNAAGKVVDEDPLGTNTDTFDVVLDSEPTADVTIELTGTQVTTSADLTFTAADWDTPQTVTITGLNDDVDEANTHAGSVSFAISGGDYGTVTEGDVAVDVNDDDTRGVTLTNTAAKAVDEDPLGTTDTFDVVLDSEPTADVTIELTGTQVATSGDLTFTAADWDQAQTVTITGLEDDIDEASPHAGSVALAISGGDYDGDTAGPVAVDVTDNDIAALALAGSPTATEGGATGSYTVALATEPIDDVTVTLVPDADVTVDDSSLTFTAANWDTPQTVTVTAVDDADAEGTHTGTITYTTASTGDTNYDTLDTSGDSTDVTITDNDGAVLVTASLGSTSVTEGGATDTFTVKLSSQPTGDVEVTMTGDAQYTLAPTGPLTFTSLDWNNAQTITVTAVNDDVDEASPAALSASFAITTSADTLSYPTSMVIGDLAIDVADNDTAGVTVTETLASTNVDESNVLTTDSYDVVLDSEPTANVVIAVAEDAQVNADVAQLTFTPANWDTPQTVTVNAVDDGVDETDPHDGVISHSATSGDTFYDGISIADVTANVADDDAAGMTVSESVGSTDVTEGGTTDSVDFVLDSQPSGDVTVTFAGAQTQVGLSDTTLTFTSTDWDTPQTVTFTAVNDDIDETPHPDATFNYTLASTDPQFDTNFGGSVTVNVTDNDTADIVVSETAVTVLEAGVTDTYTVVLASEPIDDVIVTATPASAQVSVNGEAAGDPATLTFTSATWDTPQVVTVAADDDVVAEGDHSVSIDHAASSTLDTKYDAFVVDSVTANIIDNDASVQITSQPVSLTEAAGGGHSDTYSVVLTKEPTEDVTVTPSSDDANITVSGALTFTGDNWRTPQLVTVTAVDDDVADGLQTATISNAVDSLDANYDLLPPIATFDVDAVDDDVVGITVDTGDGIAVTENGATDTFTVVLDSEPMGDVDVTMTPAEVTLSGLTVTANTITFTSANWNVPQTVTVTAIDNNDAVPGTIDFLASGFDYAGITAAQVPAVVTND